MRSEFIFTCIIWILEHSWQRGPNLPILWRPPYVACPSPFFKFCPSWPLLFSTAFQLPCFIGWISNCTTYNMLFYLMILWICTCPVLVTYYHLDLDVCFTQQGIKFTKVCYRWFFTYLISHTRTHTHTHIYIYIYIIT